jgi:hypothetical protein
MPTVAELERLRALVDRLTPVASVERGELIRAEDWNAVVGAVLEVAGAVLGEERPDVPPPHEHPDQVSAGWLAPSLRTVMEGGPLADPAATARLAAVERALAQLQARLDGVGTGVDRIRDRVAEVVTRDVVRQSELLEVRRDAAAAADGREDVLALRETMRSIDASVKAAVAAASTLTVDGRPADLDALDRRLRAVEELRERLTTSTGDLLDARTIENRLAEVAGRAVTPEDLNDALGGHRATLDDEQLEALREGVRASVLEAAGTEVRVAVDALRTETAERLAGVEADVARAVADAVPGVVETVRSALRPEVAAEVAVSESATRAAFESALDGLEATIREDVEARVAEAGTAAVEAARAEVTRGLDEAVGPLAGEVQALAGRLGTAEAALAGQGRSIADLFTAVARVPVDLAAGLAALQRSLTAEMDRRGVAADAALEERLSAFRADVDGRMDEAVGDVRRALLDEVAAAAGRAAATEAQIMANALRAEMRAIVADEASALRSEIDLTIATRATEAVASQLPGAVAQEVRRATANLPDLVRTEIGAVSVGLGGIVIRPVNPP